MTFNTIPNHFSFELECRKITSKATSWKEIFDVAEY
jgi:hypothetical protein